MADRLKELVPQQLVAAGTEGYYVSHPDTLLNSGVNSSCLHRIENVPSWESLDVIIIIEQPN